MTSPVADPDQVQAGLCDLGAGDYPAIVELWRRAGLHIRLTGRDSAESFASQMAAGSQRVIGLCAGDTLVGVAVLTHDGRKGWINRLAVDPAYRHQGLAQSLLAESERWFREVVGLGVWSALIESQNRASLALFAKAGYQTYDLVYASKRSHEDS
jgi:N-acetylglutamate synthase